MKHSFLIAITAGLLSAGPVFAATPKLFCTAAEKEVPACCCTAKEGKSFCTLTGKTFAKCCCISKAEPKTEEQK